MAKRLFVITACLSLAALSCPAQDAQAGMDTEYTRTYMAAMTTDNQTIIGDAIAYIDSARIKGTLKILNLDYNEAQLLFRLRRFDEAVALLRKSIEPNARLNLAILLLRLNRRDEAVSMLDERIASLTDTLGSATDQTKRKEIATSILLCVDLKKADPSAFLKQMLDAGTLTADEEASIQSKWQVDLVLRSMWPQ